jgi:hypothetical protein
MVMNEKHLEPPQPFNFQLKPFNYGGILSFKGNIGKTLDRWKSQSRHLKRSVLVEMFLPIEMRFVLCQRLVELDIHSSVGDEGEKLTVWTGTIKSLLYNRFPSLDRSSNLESDEF